MLVGGGGGGEWKTAILFVSSFGEIEYEESQVSIECLTLVFVTAF